MDGSCGGGEWRESGGGGWCDERVIFCAVSHNQDVAVASTQPQLRVPEVGGGAGT